MVNDWIIFPRNQREINNSAALFYEKTNFPLSFAAVDGTLVNILAPSIEEHNYVDRKGNHSKNVQVVNIDIVANNNICNGCVLVKIITRCRACATLKSLHFIGLRCVIANFIH